MPRGRGSGGKLTKLKSVLKKWQSLGKATAAVRNEENDYNIRRDCEVEQQVVAVYVGKSRRRYDISSEVAQHPVVQELVERSGDGETVECEVVLFEHLLWMLQNADPQPDSLDELLDLYA
ncbi:auxin-responsive protein SAUR77-like [Cynara cardunculus var. scolymus]|uniref:Auxin responsive SAUR protein n=1 Tax=Cynara cardunculus var. scolymus TaxID=59895 RepID=A0A118JVN7_CYNCS|nr:auxin-responsive protein SAUR77-like [Cynara cardunculus var. scolymus]KVH94044.1 Auxin responsive SAUR protein [Cynara cardunculus var. scolymus]